MENQIDLKNVSELLDLANRNEPEPEPSEKSSPRATRAASAMKAGLKKGYDAAKDIVKDALAKDSEKQTDEAQKQQKQNQTVSTTINWVVKILKDIIERLNEQGGVIKELFEEIKKVKTPSAKLTEELEKICAEVETEMNKKKDDIVNEMKIQNENLEKELKVKHDALEKKCDEGRQREMKGTLIVSSPDRERNPTLAVPMGHRDQQTNSWIGETDLDMVLRLVTAKTGVRIPISDVVACHRIGKHESHSFVLKIGNRQPYSPWDELTYGMLTGKSFNGKNVFINFMLTSRRTELSKAVRQARKDQLIQKYSIDQNGRFWIKKVGGEDRRFYEVCSIDDLEKYSKKD